MWDSATVATWLALFSRSVNGLVVLPLVLSRFSAAETAVWFLVVTINSFQVVFDGGFTPTLTRFVAYLSGKNPSTETLRAAGLELSDSTTIDHLRRDVAAAIKRVYLVLSLIGAGLLVVGGPLAVWRQASNLPGPLVGLIAVGLLVPTWIFEMNGRRFVSILEGTGHVALVRRWAALFGILTGVSNLLVVVFGGRVVALTVSSQLFRWLNVLWNRYLLERSTSETVKAWTVHLRRTDGPRDSIRALVWQKGWRAAIGVAFGFGTAQFTGIIYAQVGEPIAVASYLLAIRLLDLTKTVAQAPFYSQLPSWARMFGEGRLAELRSKVSSRLLLSLLLYSVGVVVLALAGPALLDLIGSSTRFLPLIPWTVLASSVFLERFGAMHLQSYTIGNDVVWHKINLANGLVQIILSVLFGLRYGPTGFAFALLIGNLLIYAPWALKLNTRLLKLGPADVIVRQLLLPVVLLSAGLFLANLL